MSRHFSFLTIILGGIVSLGLVTASAAQSGRSATQAAAAAPDLCVDGEGPTYGFFCAPRVQNRGIAACSKNLSGIALTQCREASANNFCQSAGFTRAVLFEVNAQGQLAEVTCNGRTAPATVAVAAPAPATPPPAPAAQPGANYEPMFDTDFFGNDLPSSFTFQRAGSSWQQCAAACDNDRNCKAFTYVVPGRTEFGECFLKDSVPEPSYGGCCTSGVKGVGPTAASATSSQPASGQSSPSRSGGQRSENLADRLAREAADEAEQRAKEETRRGVRGLMNRVIRIPD